jgi:hypothetical protein
MALSGAPARGDAQITGGLPTSEVLLTTEFRTPLTYQAALAKLDEYYQEQVGRKVAVAFPEIAPKQHYDIWHDIWVTFEGAGELTLVTMKRPADSITGRLIKNWMLGFAGRLQAEIPLTYKDLPALYSADADIYATPKDVAAALRGQASLKPLASWQHQGLVVSAAPMESVTMSSAGVHGVHRLTVTAESAVAARQLLAKVMLGAQKPCICAVYSEAAELDAEIRKEAQGRSDSLSTGSTGAIYVPQLNQKRHEDRVRADPEMQKRIAQTTGYYSIRYRIDKPYRQAILTWTELQEYSRESGKFKRERTVGRSVIANPKPTAQAAAQVTARTKMEPLPPGVYRVRLDGEAAPGQSTPIDERIYWFDGKTFEEL